MSEWVDFTAIKRHTDIARVLEHYGVRLRRVGPDGLRGPCPLPMHRSEQSRESFQVQTSRNVWACHSASCCAARGGNLGGNVLDLVACLEGCSIREAALRLQNWSEVERKTGGQDELVSKGKRAGPRQERLARLPFRLRLRWHPYLEQRGIDRLTAAWFGVGYYAGSGFLRERMVFPIHDERAQLVGYAGRRLDGAEPRYLFPPGFGKSQVLYNLHRALGPRTQPGGRAIVVEGFFDCMKVHQAGYVNVVALLGTSLSAQQAELLARHFRDLVVLLDGDEAGRRASRTLAARWPGAHVVWLPAGRQPDQLSPEEMQGILRKAVRFAPAA